MTGEAVAGYIDIKTFSPSDVEGLSGSFDYGFGEQDLGGGDVDRYSGRISYSNDAFGILVFASKTGNEQVTTNLDDMDSTYTEGGIIPSRIRTNNYFVDYGNEASGVTGEFYFGNGGRVFYKYLDTEFLDFEERNQWQIDLRRIENPTPNTGYAPDARGNRALEYGKYNNTTEVQTLGTDFFVANWNVEMRASDIELKSETWLPLPYMSWSDGVTYDVSDPSDPFFSFDTPLADLQYDPIFAVFDFLNYWGEQILKISSSSLTPTRAMDLVHSSWAQSLIKRRLSAEVRFNTRRSLNTACLGKRLRVTSSPIDFGSLTSEIRSAVFTQTTNPFLTRWSPEESYSQVWKMLIQMV